MRPTPWLLAEPNRIQLLGGYNSQYGDAYGAFLILFPRTGTHLRCIAVDGAVSRAAHGDAWAWDHVSVSTERRIPNWLEMSFIKSIFWSDDEAVMQLHVPVADHIDIHPNVLHLWRPLLAEIPMPPTAAV